MKTIRFLILVALPILLAMQVGAQEFKHEAQPLFQNCADGSYERALKDGITLGFSPSPPYTFLDSKTKKPMGIDWEINVAALEWMGVTDIRYEIMPWNSLIPSILSKRIDVITANIHITPDRIKVISFTGPAWWYGPAIITKKGNPFGIKSYDDLKGRKVGAISGSAADEYLRHIGADVAPFQTDLEEFTSIQQGRVDVILEDDVKFAEYLKSNPDVNLEVIPGIDIPDELIYNYGYGYARYAVRIEDCSLRAAFTQALAEVRGNGKVSSILKKWGLSNRNLFWFPVCK